MQVRSQALLFFMFLFLIGRITQAEDVYTVIVKKQEQKKQKRWSLADWLDTKEKIRAMDLWLAIHSSANDYEFFISGEQANLTLAPIVNGEEGEKTTSYLSRGSVGLYANIIGLEAYYQISPPELRSDLQGYLSLRVLGFAEQATHLNLQYGIRQLNITATPQEEKVQNQAARAEMTLYLLKHFGVSGAYTYVFPATSNQQNEFSSVLTEASGFIDFSFIRVFGRFSRERQLYRPSDQTEKQESQRDSLGGGIQFFF